MAIRAKRDTDRTSSRDGCGARAHDVSKAQAPIDPIQRPSSATGAAQ